MAFINEKGAGDVEESNMPAMSVVVVTPDRFETVRKMVRHLRAQSVKGLMEIVLVAPSEHSLALDAEELRGFHSYRVVEVGTFDSSARARAAGVRHSRGRVVALAEDHSFPAPGWAEKLIEAHKGDWAAVGPVMANANPRSAVSWANLLIEYAPWLEGASGGEAEHLPGHNGSYKREALMHYGDRLEEMLDAESVLHWDLRARGLRLYLETGARTFHQNFDAPAASVPLRFNGGRLFAAARSREWPFWRRALYAVAAPLIPAVRAARIVREVMKREQLRPRLPRVILPLVAMLAFDGLGEMVGYAAGAGGAMAKLTDMEFHRHRYVTKPNRDVEASTPT